MMNSLINKSVSLLPLMVKQVSWDGDTFVIAGDGWSFSTLSAWRVVKGKSVQFACWDKDVNESVDELNGLDIIAVNHQGATISVDPVFELSDGRSLEIFSTDTVEPWILRLSDGKVYIGGT